MRTKAAAGDVVCSMLEMLHDEAKRAGEVVDKRVPWIDRLIDRATKTPGASIIRKRRSALYNYSAFAKLARDYPFILYCTHSFTSITRAITDVRAGCKILTKTDVC